MKPYQKPRYINTGGRLIRLHTREEMGKLSRQFSAWRKEQLYYGIVSGPTPEEEREKREFWDIARKEGNTHRKTIYGPGLETDLGVNNPNERARSQIEAVLKANALRKRKQPEGVEIKRVNSSDDLYYPDFSTEP